MKFLRSSAGVLAAATAAMLSQNASAVNITADGIGEVAIAPYYTVRDGKQTLISLTNTTNVPVAVKVRFHEASNSRDVLDFVVALSGNDVFVGTLFEEPGSGQVRFRSNDSVNTAGLPTCTVPQLQPTGLAPVPNVQNFPSAPLSTGGYFGGTPSNTDDGAQTADVNRSREGYVEFIVLGYFDDRLRRVPGTPNTFLSDARVVYGTPGFTGLSARLNMVGQAIERHDCEVVTAAFTEPNVLSTAQQAGEPFNTLKFNFTILDAQGGTEAGATSTTWANFYNPGGGSGLNGFVLAGDDIDCSVHRGRQRSTGLALQPNPADWFPNGAAGSCRNFIAAQQSPQFLEPTLNDAFPAVATFQDDDLGVWVAAVPVYRTDDAAVSRQIRGVDAVSATMMRERIINEWSINPAQGVSTEWIVTQPTKLFYVDQGNGDQFAIIGTRNDANSNGLAETFTPRTNGGVEVRPTAYVTHNNTVGGAPELAAYRPYSQRFRSRLVNGQTVGASCSAATFSVFDRAEQSPPQQQGEVDFSPAPPLDVTPAPLCFETTVVTFGTAGDVSDPNSLDRNKQGRNRLHLSVAGLPSSPQPGGGSAPNTSGWVSLTLFSSDPNAPASPNAYLPLSMQTASVNGAGVITASAAPPLAGVNALTGLPVIGFALKTRQFPNRPDLSFASNSDHSYIRNYGTFANLFPADGATGVDQPDP